MKTQELKTWLLILTLLIVLRTSALRAQTWTAPVQAYTTGSNPVDWEFRADGTMIAKGNWGVGSLLTGDQGAGVRLLWFPSARAFRAGVVYGTQWNTANIGDSSAAFGYNTTASNFASTAFGGGATASGFVSTASGSYTTASGKYSTALGGYSKATGSVSTASGYYTLASGSYSTASGGYATASGGGGSVALGYFVTASGSSSAVFGRSSLASGQYSTAMGYFTTASGYGSTAFGNRTTASGHGSTASGYETNAQAYGAFVIGQYNVGGGTSGSWVSTDSLFEIGNGTSSTHADAAIVYKNGDAGFHGAVRVHPAGDISMGSFTSSPVSPP